MSAPFVPTDIYAAIPDELKRLRQWIVWKFETMEGVVKKMPYNSVTNTKAQVNNPGTWNSFKSACDATGYDGIGFVFDGHNELVFIDLDNKQNDPAVEANHQKAIEYLDSYTERSPSGKGYHIIAKGVTAAAGARGGNYEIYSDKRYATFTGDCVRKAGIIETRQDQISKALAWLEKLKSDNRPAIANQAPSEHLQALVTADATISDRAIYDMACAADNGEKFLDLWNGNYGKYYNSKSEGDFALVNIIVFYTKNYEQAKGLFAASALGQAPKNVTRLDYLFNRMFVSALDRVQAPVHIEDISLEELQAKWAAKKAAEAPAPLALAAPVVAPPAPAPVVAPIEQPAAYVPPTAYSFPPGLVGEIAQYFYDASPHPIHEASLVAALGVVAGISGRVYQVNNLGLNLYMCFLGKSCVGKNAISTGIGKLISAIPFEQSAMFRGPKSFASAASFDTTFAQSACFVSVIGEFGKKLKKFTAVNAKPTDEDISAAYLEAFTASSKGLVWAQTARSDKTKAANPVVSPSLTLVTESTPLKFYAAINEDNIEEGLVSRLLVIEYKGDRENLSETFMNVKPSDDMINRIKIMMTLSHQNQIATRGLQHIDVIVSDEAKALFKELAANEDRHIRAQTDDNIRTLWGRTYEKVAKLAGVVAVGCVYGQGAVIDDGRLELSRGVAVPTITGAVAEWAINLVVHEISEMVSVYEKGKLGEKSDDVECIKKMISEVAHYVTVGPKKYQPENDNRFRTLDPFAMCISNSYLAAKCNTKSFMQHKNGHTRTVKDTAKALIDMGKLIEVRGEQKTKYNTEMILYQIIV